MRTVLLLFLASLLLFLTSTPRAQQPTFIPVASVNQLMKAIVIPTSEAIFQVAMKAPETDEEWTAMQNNALTLAESGNLLMIGSRAKNTAVWMKTSQALVDAGAAALKAAEAKDLEALADAGNQIVDACETCHEKHWDKSHQN